MATRTALERARAELRGLPFDSDEAQLDMILGNCYRLNRYRVVDGRFVPFQEPSPKDYDGAPGGVIPMCGHPFRWFGGQLMLSGRLGSPSRALRELDRRLEREPGDAAALSLRGRVQLQLLRLDEALTDFERLAALDPGSPDAYDGRGRTRLLRTELTAALRDLDQAVRLGSKDPWTRAWRSEARRLLEDRRGARADIDALLRLEPRRSAFWLLKSRIGTMRDLERAVALDPGSFWARALRGHCRYHLGDARAALEDFDVVVRLNPQQWSYCRRSQAHVRLGRMDLARRDWGRQLEQCGDAILGPMLFKPLVRCPVYNGIGADRWIGAMDLETVTARLAKDPRRAWDVLIQGQLVLHEQWTKEACARARRLDPRSWYFRAAEARTLSAADPPAARREFDRLIRELPRMGCLYAWRAEALWRLGDVTGVERDCRQAIALAKEESVAYFYLGLALQRQGRPAEALEALNAEIEFSPRWPQMLLLRRELRFAQGDIDGAFFDMNSAARIEEYMSWANYPPGSGKDYDRALTELAAAAQRWPAHAWVHAWRGRVFLETGRYREAVRCLDRALRLDDRCAWAYAWRGECRLAQGRPDAARADLDAAVRFDPLYHRAYGARAAAALLLGEGAGAIADIDRFLQCAIFDGGAFVFRARLRRMAGSLERAERELGQHIPLNPNDTWALHERFQVRRRRGDAAGAFEDLRLSFEHPGVCGFGISEKPWVEVAPVPELVAELVDEARRRPKDAWPAAWMGALQLCRPSAPTGTEALDLALRLDPRNAWARAWRGATLLRLGKARDALAELDRALAAMPACAFALEEKAQALALLGDLPGALEQARRPAEAPRRARTRTIEAQILSRLGRGEAAIGALDAALVALPDAATERLYIYRSRLKRLAGEPAAALRDLSVTFNCAWAFYERGLCKSALGDVTGGLRDLESVRFFQDDAARPGFRLPQMSLIDPFDPAAELESERRRLPRASWPGQWLAALRAEAATAAAGAGSPRPRELAGFVRKG